MEVCPGSDGSLVLEFWRSDALVTRDALSNWHCQMLDSGADVNDEDLVWASATAAILPSKACILRGMSFDEAAMLSGILLDYAQQQEVEFQNSLRILGVRAEQASFKYTIVAARALKARRISAAITNVLLPEEENPN